MNDFSWTPSPYASFMQQMQIELENGISLHVEMSQNIEQPTILLIMGLGGQLLLWHNAFCQSLIEQGFHVIRYDHRDIGLSSKTSAPPPALSLKNLMAFQCGVRLKGANYTLEDLATDAHLLMKALKIPRYHVLGASMGGMVAQILASRYPQHVQRLALLFTSNNQAFSTLPNLKTLLNFLKSPPSQDEHDIILFNARLLQSIGTPQHQHDVLSFQLAQQLYHRSYYPKGFVQHLSAILATGSLRPYDATILQDTLVLHGTADKLIPCSHGKAVANAIKGAKFMTLDGMGHDLPAYYLPQLSQSLSQHFAGKTSKS